MCRGIKGLHFDKGSLLDFRACREHIYSLNFLGGFVHAVPGAFPALWDREGPWRGIHEAQNLIRFDSEQAMDMERVAWTGLVRELSGPRAARARAKADRGMAKCTSRLLRGCVRALWDARRRAARLKTFESSVSRSVGGRARRRVFEGWRRSAERYWVASVKIQRVRGISRHLLCGVYIATWRLHVMLRRRVHSLATRVWLRLGRDTFCEWGEYTNEAISYAGRVEVMSESLEHTPGH